MVTGIPKNNKKFHTISLSLFGFQWCVCVYVWDLYTFRLQYILSGKKYIYIQTFLFFHTLKFLIDFKGVPLGVS